MGACICKTKVHQSVHEYICNSLLLAIENGRRVDVEQLFFRFMRSTSAGESPVFNIDEKIINLQDVRVTQVPLNALAYAFRAGQSDIAEFLIDVGKASLVTLYETYQQIGRTPMDIACEYGFLELVQFFLPIHLLEGHKYAHSNSPHESMEELSIFSDGNKQRTTMNPEATLRYNSPFQPAIHRACEHGHVDVVKWIYGQFKGKTPPPDFDINAVDERAGENCALISVRNGNLTMMRFLYEECTADFHRLNRRRENAVQIAVIGSKRKPGISFINCVKYLVEIVRVDLTYEYEETLLICEDKVLVFYLESQLAQRGIVATKTKVDLDNSITRNRAARQMSKKSQELEQKCKTFGSKFQLKELFTEQASKSEDISSIPHQSEISGLLTPF